MKAEARVRGAVARRVWPTNPHSLALAEVAVMAARAVDVGAGEPLRRLLGATLRALADCQAEPDGIDELRVAYARRRLDVLTKETEGDGNE